GAARQQPTGQTGQLEGVEDQADAAVAEDRAAREPVDSADVASQRLGDVLLTEQLVDEQRAAPLGVVHDDQQRLGRVLGRAGDVVQARQPEDRQQLVAQSDELAAAGDGRELGPIGLEADVDAGGGYDVSLLPDPDDHPVGDRQRERQPQRERRPLAGFRRDLDAAAERLDRRADDVHPDATAGDVRDLLGGRKAGLEDQVVDLGVGEPGRARDEPALDRLRGDPVAVEAAPVVAHLDDDAATPVGGAQPDRAGARLAPTLALVRRLDAVVDRVTDHVEQRVGDDVDHVPVDLGVLALG